MEEKELVFDRDKHICYSDSIKAIIQRHLADKYDEETASIMWEKIQRKYVEYLEDLPYLGGKKCNHNAPGGTYDCIAIFAFYEVQDIKPSIEEMYDMNNEAFLPPFRRLGKIANLNKKWMLKAMAKIFKMSGKADKKIESRCPTGYIMDVSPYDETGIHYKFYRCPIAEFAKAHNMTHIMPAFCNGDYPAIELLKGGFLREYTCANGDYCDYWIVGSESPYLKEYPLEIDEQGYMRNRNLPHNKR